MEDKDIVEKIVELYLHAKNSGESAASLDVVYKNLEHKIYIWNYDKLYSITKNDFLDILGDDIKGFEILSWAK